MGEIIVSLDVEGVLFKTKLSTLCSAPGYFSELFKKDWIRELDKNGCLFIDRDSIIFRIILNFLRDGPTIPLPDDDFTLMRIAQEANFFGLTQLKNIVERKISYDPLPFKEKTKKMLNLKQHKEASSKKQEKDRIQKKKIGRNSYEGRSLPPTPFESTPILNDYDRMLIDSPPIPIRKSTLEKQKRKESVDSISHPRNFTHVAHVGWNGSGVIFEQRLANADKAVKAIMRAAGEADLNPVYNVVNGEDAQYGSNSVEVFLAGPHMKAKDYTTTVCYSSPQKRPLPPPKPLLIQPQRPASANE